MVTTDSRYCLSMYSKFQNILTLLQNQFDVKREKKHTILDIKQSGHKKLARCLGQQKHNAVGQCGTKQPSALQADNTFSLPWPVSIGLRQQKKELSPLTQTRTKLLDTCLQYWYLLNQVFPSLTRNKRDQNILKQHTLQIGPFKFSRQVFS